MRPPRPQPIETIDVSFVLPTSCSTSMLLQMPIGTDVIIRVYDRIPCLCVYDKEQTDSHATTGVHSLWL
ncbi:hypothetical protein BLOT_007814 [Blomia tropicalis]|nr:hypothetical protein BLOT_007814 [Blomia tropicalis]